MAELLILVKPTNKFYDIIVAQLGKFENTPVFSNNFKDFLHDVTNIKNNKKVVLLCIENESDLKYLSNLQHLLSSSKIIILLPERRKDMLKNTLFLNPSLLLFAKNKDTIETVRRVLKDSVNEYKQVVK